MKVSEIILLMILLMIMAYSVGKHRLKIAELDQRISAIENMMPVVEMENEEWVIIVF